MCLVPDSENSRSSNRRSSPSPVLFANSQNKFEKGTEPQNQKQKFHSNEFTLISADSSQNPSVTLYIIYCSSMSSLITAGSIQSQTNLLKRSRKPSSISSNKSKTLQSEKSSTFELIAAANTKANSPLSLNPSASSMSQLLPILINQTAKLND